MNPSDILTKTPAGIEELKARALKLPPRLRTMLIMVDGMRTVTQLREAAAALGAPDDCLDTLVAAGLVSAPARLENDATSAQASTGPDASGSAVAPVSPAHASNASQVGNTAKTDAPSHVDRFTAARKLMNDTAVDELGLRAFLFTLKLERCSTADDLRALLPGFAQSLSKARDESFANRTVDRVRNLLG